jgi:hypothetical protein
VLQAVQARLPAAAEKVPAGHTPQTPLLVGVHGVPAPVEEPAGHETQLEQGAMPVAFQFTPATHGVPQTLLTALQEKPAVVLQPQTDWPVRPSETPFCAEVGHAVHELVGTGATEYVLAAQAVHTTLAVVVQLAALLDVPAAHTVHGVHVDAPAAVEKLLPATQDAQTRFAVGVHVEAT